jgi:molybdenum cofactor cytidylyltransferase
MTVGAIILAAGRSTRMGLNKLVADLCGRPVIAHVVDAVHEAELPSPIVVLGHQPAAIAGAIGQRSVQYVSAPDYAEGLSRSLAAGIAAVPDDWTAAIVCLGDMPLVKPGLLRQIAFQASSEAIVIPVGTQGRGNPVAWGRSHFSLLRGLSGDRGGKALFPQLETAIIEVRCEDESILLDADTPAGLGRIHDVMSSKTVP